MPSFNIINERIYYMAKFIYCERPDGKEIAINTDHILFVVDHPTERGWLDIVFTTNHVGIEVKRSVAEFIWGMSGGVDESS